MGLREPRETIEVSGKFSTAETRTGRLAVEHMGGTHPGKLPMPLEMDLVTHDVKKFFELMLKRNGYVLEQLYSPLVVHTTPEHEELKEIGTAASRGITAIITWASSATQWELFRKEDPPRVKPLLYVYRVLLTGIHLMRTGKVEANLLKLNTRDLGGQGFPLPYIDDLVARKAAGGERSRLPALSEVEGTAADLEFHHREYSRLTAELEQAGLASTLPEKPSTKDAMSDLLLRVRRTQCVSASNAMHRGQND